MRALILALLFGGLAPVAAQENVFRAGAAIVGRTGRSRGGPRPRRERPGAVPAGPVGHARPAGGGERERGALALDVLDATGEYPYTGEVVPIAEARIPILDWGFLRSDATYDVVTVWEGAFFRLDAHLERLELLVRGGEPEGEDGDGGGAKATGASPHQQAQHLPAVGAARGAGRCAGWSACPRWCRRPSGWPRR